MNRRWVKLALSAALAGLALTLAGCANTPEGKQIDDWCVAGKLTESGAAYLQATRGESFKIHKDFTAPIAKDFRLVAGDCSEALRAAADLDAEELERRLKALQKNDD